MATPTHTLQFFGDNDRQALQLLLKSAMENPSLDLDGKRVANMFVERIARAKPVLEQTDDKAVDGDLASKSE